MSEGLHCLHEKLLSMGGISCIWLGVKVKVSVQVAWDKKKSAGTRDLGLAWSFGTTATSEKLK